jgi:hypothetical protein
VEIPSQRSPTENPLTTGTTHGALEASVAEKTNAQVENEGHSSTASEHSTNNQHQPTPPGSGEHMMNTDDFINSSAGYTRTAKTGDSTADDGTSVSKPLHNIYFPPSSEA